MSPNPLNLGSVMCLTRDDPKLNHFEQIEALVNAGAQLIQLRAKSIPSYELYVQAKQAIELTKKNNCKLIINDHFELAKEINADGVHLGMEDAPVEYVRRQLAPGTLIGKTIHSKEDALIGVSENPDYFGLGPYRHSSTKKELLPVLTDENFISIIGILNPIPVFLIGGLTLEDLPLVDQFNIQGIALCSALYSGNETDIQKVLKKSSLFEQTLNFSSP